MHGSSRYHWVILAVCMLLPACGPAFIHEKPRFDAEKINCRIQNIPEFEGRQRAIRKEFQEGAGDLYLMWNIDSILADMKYWADDGDPEAMAAYGQMRWEFLAITYLKGMYGLFAPRLSEEAKIFPKEQRANIVIALSYMYISSNVDTVYKKILLKELRDFEEGRESPEIPPRLDS